MKTIINYVACVIITALIVFCLMVYLSEKDQKKQIVEQVTAANRQLTPPYGTEGPLVSIVWYKDMLLVPYKIFSDYRDIGNISYRLSNKGLQSNIDRKAVFNNSEDRLAFVYYSDRENSYRMAYLPFRIEGDIFYWPYGEDKKIARMLLEKERWGVPDYTDPWAHADRFSKINKKVEEKLSLKEQNEKIDQIRKPLAVKDTLTAEERSLLETCDAALRNLLEIKSYACGIEGINDLLRELNEMDLWENIVDSFAQIPKSTKENYGPVITPEAAEKIRQFSEKYNEEGLTREEQKELLQIRQEIDKKILDELQRRQEDFNRILQITVKTDKQRERL